MEQNMRKIIILASVAAMAAPAITLTVVPVEAQASARDCRNAATAGGAVGGAVIGGGLARGGVGGAILGGLGGALIGHEVARHNCGSDHRYYEASCRVETHYRDHRPYQVRMCAGRDGVWRPA
jgi:uncharacterized protein YcfJ